MYDRQEVRALGLSPFSYTVIDSILIKARSFKQIIFRSYQVVRNTKEAREKALMTMSSEEIMHLAHTGGIAQAKIYYAYFAREAAEREERERKAASMRSVETY